jgi:large subunit ribosomal protein L10
LGLNLEQKQAVVAGEMTELRKRARNSGVYLRVLKNTLARRAIADTPFKGLVDKMVGPLAYGMSSDPVAAAKVLHEYARSNEKFVIRAGAMLDVVMSPKEVGDLARMPGLVGTMQAPLAKLVRTLNEVPGKFVRTVAAVHAQKEKQAA